MTALLLPKVEQALLAPANVSLDAVASQLGQLNGKQVDAADIYFQSNAYESWFLEDGQVKDGSYSVDQGVGIRVISGEKTGFAYADEISLEALQEAGNAASAITTQGQTQSVSVGTATAAKHLYGQENPIVSLDAAAKIALMEKLDGIARAEDSRVQQVMVSLAAVYENVLVMAVDGTLAADIRPLVRCNVSVIVNEKGRTENAAAGGGGRFTYSELLLNDKPEEWAKEAVRLALVNLEAVSAPAGQMPVVLGSGWPGVLLHEAVGHGLEGDFNRKGSSAFSGRVGEKVASELCTVVDDGTLENRRGSLSVDDEGTPTQCTTLIENGVLKNYMQDKLNASLMGTVSTGNGRRESYAHLPMPRMTNTYMLAGKSNPQDMIASIDKGIYAVNFGGGQVDITSGKFVFTASEAYLIENGKVTSPVKGATLIGDGPEVMQQISMVGNDLSLDEGVGVCGKEGQSVAVGVGQPSLKIDNLTVGGTQA